MFVLKYPLVYLIAGLYILFVGGADNGYISNPGGDNAAFLYMEDDALVLQQFQGEEVELVRPVQVRGADHTSKLQGFSELRSGRRLDEQGAFNFAEYLVKMSEGDDLLLELRYYEDCIIYRLTNRRTEDGDAFAIYADLRDSGDWTIVPVLERYQKITDW